LSLWFILCHRKNNPQTAADSERNRFGSELAASRHGLSNAYLDE